MKLFLTAFLLLPGAALAQDDTPSWLRDDPKPAAHVAAPPPRVQSQPVQEAPPDDAKQPLIGTNPQQPIPPERAPRAQRPMQQTYANDFPPPPQQAIGSLDDTDDPDAPQQAPERSSVPLALCPPIDLPNPGGSWAVIYSVNPNKEQCIPCRNLHRMLLAAGCTIGTFKKHPEANFIEVYLKNRDAFARRNLTQAPTIIFFIDNQEDSRVTGFDGTQEEIKAIIAKHPMSRAIRNAKALLKSVGDTDDNDYPPDPRDNSDQRSHEWDAYRYGGTQSATKYGGTQSPYKYGGTQSAYHYGSTQAAYQYGGTQASYPVGNYGYANPVQTFYESAPTVVQSAPVYSSGNMVCGPQGCRFVR